jgi:4-hydroxybenzoate polyprenyltransferase
VFDEHKDYADDCRYYPERILSRGLVTLTHLKILGGLAIAIEILCAGVSGAPAMVAVGVTIFFSWVMLHEFFVRDWLRAHFIIYAIAHMLIMPLMTATIFSFTMRRHFWEAPWLFWVYAAADFLAFANWEISRKIRLPQDEQEGLASYSKEFGMFKATAVVLVLRVINTSLAWIVGIYLNLGKFYYGGLIALFLLTLVGIVHFRLHPTRRSAKNLEAYGGAYIIFFYFVLAAELFRTHGLVFEL